MKLTINVICAIAGFLMFSCSNPEKKEVQTELVPQKHLKLRMGWDVDHTANANKDSIGTLEEKLINLITARKIPTRNYISNTQMADSSINDFLTLYKEQKNNKVLTSMFSYIDSVY